MLFQKHILLDKIMATDKQILSLQIAAPNITSNETQPGMYSVASL